METDYAPTPAPQPNPNPDKGEEYWHEKHPLTKQMYAGRPLPNGGKYTMDVRHFVWEDDFVLDQMVKLQRLNRSGLDETALNCQRSVCDTMKYYGDETIGAPEYWLFPSESLNMQRGDCEDGAILMASLLLNALPSDEHWRVRVSAGWVQERPTAPQGGHAYVTYCRELDNEWVALDWCYLEDPDIPVHEKPRVKDVAVYKDVWFSFNHRFSWAHTSFDLQGRVRNNTD